MTNEKLPDVGPVLLWALELPDFARPEYFIRAQEKSGWNKWVYLRLLLGEVDHYETKWQIYSGKERSDLKKKGEKLPDDYGIDLKEETNGIQKGKLTKKLIEDLRFAVEQTYKWNIPEPAFDSLQIIAFCERLMLFVKSQYEEQLQPYSSIDFVVNRLKSKGHVIEGNPTHVVYRYTIITDAPIGSFYRLKTEIRKLLLNSPNVEQLKTMMKPLKELCSKIVDLWNNELYVYDEPIKEKDMNKAVREHRLMSFDYGDLTMWHRNVQYDDEYYREAAKHFTNRDFAVFAAHTANLISYEVLKEKKTAKNYQQAKVEFKDLDEIFTKPEKAIEFYKILIDEDLLSSQITFIRGPKVAYCLWARELARAGVIKYLRDDELTVLMNNKFTGLKMGPSTFRSNMENVSKDFQSRFRKAINDLSNSNNSNKN